MRSANGLRARVVGSLCVAAALSGGTARAQATAGGSDKVAAEALFEDGRRLVAAAKFADACPKFVESQRLDPSPSTLLNLANCWEKLGRTATAWAAYREAESAANAAGRKDYVDAAERHARLLSPELARLTVAVTQPVDGLQVRRDGVEVGAPEWGLAIPVDAGAHSVEASAPGYKGWSAQVDVPHDGAQVTATVPALEALPPEVVPPAGAANASPGLAKDGAGASAGGGAGASSGGSTQRTVGLVVGAAGVVGLGVSGVLAALASAKNQDSKNAGCSNDVCPSQASLDDRNAARSTGDAATVALVVGAAAVAVGAVVWLTAPKASSGASARVLLAPVPGGAVIAGAW